MPSHSKLGYRAHIDGLRAIAVLGIAIFHFGGTVIPGGFIGVDVFFVISGFLIANSLYREVAAGQFSILEFYERRARRILPAFVAVTAVTSIAAFLVLSPTELISYAQSLLYSSFFLSNTFFFRTLDYFAPSANQIPLLHLWSLAVEEQFYLAFPLIVIAVTRFSRLPLASVIGALALTSLLASEIVLRVNPPLAFYFTPFRAFELLTGALLALPQMRFPVSKAIAGMSSIGGLMLLLAGLVVISERMRFPGLLALVPCGGTAAIIWAGERVRTPVTALLGASVFTFIGRISYSLYLVHWPIVVFFERLFPDVDRVTFFVVGISFSIAIATLSYHWVEQPFRRGIFLGGRRSIFAGSAAALIACMIPAWTMIYADGFPGRVSGRANELLAHLNYNYKDAYQSGTCFLRREQTASDLHPDCIPATHPSAILWGDSSVAQLYSGLQDPLAQRGVALGQMTASACPPLIGLAQPSRPNCFAFNEFALAQIIRARPDVVILGAFWTSYDLDFSYLNATLDHLRAAQINAVVLGANVAFKRPVPTMLAERLTKGGNNRSSELLTDVIFKTDADLRRHLQARSGVRHLSILETVCAGQSCPTLINSVPMHFDTMHLTREGSAYYGRLLAPKILNSLTDKKRRLLYGDYVAEH